MTASQLLHKQRYEIASRFALRSLYRADVAGKMASTWYNRHNIQLGMAWNERAAAATRSAEKFMELAASEEQMAQARTLLERYGC